MATVTHTTAAPGSDHPRTPSRRLLLTGATALASIAASMSASAAPAAVGPSPDAALIALCAAHPALIDAYNTCDGPSEAEEAAWDAYAASRDAIDDARPVTLAGMRAKALAAKAEARGPDGSESPGNGPAENWAWDLVNDLLRLTGGAA